jgi:heme oxygenase
MKRPSDARSVLREATAADHERVDRAFGHFDLTDREGYTAFLLAQAHGFLPIEAAIDAADPRDLLPDWAERRRADRLLADLAALGVSSPATASWPDFHSQADILGAIYVLEGSRLGGSMLARSVPAGLPRSFIGAADTARWRKLIELLDKRLTTSDQHALAIDAARRAFALFEDGALRHGRTKAFD